MADEHADLLRRIRHYEDFLAGSDARELASYFIEGEIGMHGVPLGIVEDAYINEKFYDVPMATEEASIVAAVRFWNRLLRPIGGIQTTALRTIVKGQVLVETQVSTDEILRYATSYTKQCDKEFPQMIQRGGIATDVSVRLIEKYPDSTHSLHVVTLYIDSRDAMGAHRSTEMAQWVGACFKRDGRGIPIASIVSNNAHERCVRAQTSIPHKIMRRITGKQDAVTRLERMFVWAKKDIDRAVTHNKGIMNGVTAVVLASGNDTRAAEAAAHAYASKGGRYHPLSWCEIGKNNIDVFLELPVVIGTVGDGVRTQLGSRRFFDLVTRKMSGAQKNTTNSIGSSELSSVIAGIGLIQNIAALTALIGRGIQYGHMPLHEKRRKISQITDIEH